MPLPDLCLRIVEYEFDEVRGRHQIVFAFLSRHEQRLLGFADSVHVVEEFDAVWVKALSGRACELVQRH